MRIRKKSKPSPVLSQEASELEVLSEEASELLVEKARPIPKKEVSKVLSPSPSPKARGRPVGVGIKGTFAGRRPCGDPDVWHARIMHYWDTRKELAANYPGKACKLPSVSQEKYWRFVSNFMKENCNKDKHVRKPRSTRVLWMQSRLTRPSSVWRPKMVSVSIHHFCEY